jgi:hypothetical protein
MVIQPDTQPIRFRDRIYAYLLNVVHIFAYHSKSRR